MDDLDKLWIDWDKYREISKEFGVTHYDASLEELEKMKADLVKEDSSYEKLELGNLKDFLDLANSIFNNIWVYHQRHGYKKYDNKPIEKPKPERNKEWHKENKLRSFATLDEKVKWHIDHVANCPCSDGHIPLYIRKEIDKRLKK